MKPQPLTKEKAEPIGRGVDPKVYVNMFFESDVASAVAWLKKKINELFSGETDPHNTKFYLHSIIDEAFAGIVEAR